MFDILKNIKCHDMITIDNNHAYNLTNSEDFEVLEIQSFQSDEYEVVILDLDNDYFLIAHNFCEDPQYFIVEASDAKIIDPDEETIVLPFNKKKVKYHCVDDGWKYLQNEEGEIGLCELESGVKRLILIDRDSNIEPYHGYTIDEDTIVI